MQGTGTVDSPYIVDNWQDFVTAVGTFGTYVEFPKNFILTSDTEIKEGKLYVDSTGEPVINPVTENLSSYYENTFVLDQNDYAPDGLAATLKLNCKSLNGNGGTITNIYFKTGRFEHVISGGNYNGTIKNVNFSNVLVRETAQFMYFNAVLSKCIFSVWVGSGSRTTIFTAYSSNEGIIRNCSIYVGSSNAPDINIDASLGTSASQYNRVFLNIQSDNSSQNTTVNGFRNSLIQGKSRKLSLDSLAYSVIDCEIDGVVSGNNLTRCVINSDKVSGSITGAAAVTSDQMIDAEYLSSIGFPIQT